MNAVLPPTDLLLLVAVLVSAVLVVLALTRSEDATAI